MCKYTTIFTIIDDFCKTYEDWISHKLLTSGKQRHRKGKLTLSEAISVMIFYHFSQFKHFKIFYQHFIMNGRLFKNPPCYERFILPYARILEYRVIKPSLVLLPEATVQLTGFMVLSFIWL